MHLISRKALKSFGEIHASARTPLDNWYRIIKRGTWGSFQEMKGTFPSCDLVGRCYVFNVGGNKYRVITKIYFDTQTVLVRAVLTHKEYDKGDWKEDCGA